VRRRFCIVRTWPLILMALALFFDRLLTGPHEETPAVVGAFILWAIWACLDTETRP